MISTFYSNSFEILQEVLITKLRHDIEDMRCAGASVFESIPVIVPTPLIEDRLKRGLADRLGVVPGLEFKNTAQWLFTYLTSSLSNDEISGQMDWVLYDLLKKKKANARVEPGEERLSSYLEKLDDIGVLEFARHLNNVFVTYGSYRFDWLKDWTEEITGKLKHSFSLAPNPQEKQRLENNPDFLWQKKLWQDLARETGLIENGKTRGRILSWVENTISGLADIKVEEGTSAVHLFMPFSFAPIMLPLIRSFGLSTSSRTLHIYLLNPSSEYWFESVPKKLFDWDDSVLSARPGQTAALAYLQTNAASTRAAIDRLDNFLNASEEAAAVEGEPTEEAFAARRETEMNPRTRAFCQNVTPLDVATDTETDSAYLQYPQDSFLHRFQNSLLKLDNRLLPVKPDPDDVSLRILQAPSLMREVESVIDILHNWFADPKRDLNPSDVMIAVPDIEAAAPVIEGVMTSLPNRKDLRLEIPWKILNRSESQINEAAVAFISVAKLLASNFEAQNFYTVLEQSALQQSFGFDLSDLSILKTWLTAAGYRLAIDRRQSAELDLNEEDTSLQEAIERLMIGYFTDPSIPTPFGSVLPIRGDEESGFDRVTDESGRLFKAICNFYEVLKQTRDALCETNFRLPASEWRPLLRVIRDRFIAGAEASERFSFDKTLDQMCASLEETFADNREDIPFDIVVSELESYLSKGRTRPIQTGALTFAPIEAVRGLPYKVIVCLGFDELSGFPGTPKFEEFDLMKTVRRRADRDARKDNNAVFLDTMLSARENLILSYSVGAKPQSDNNPSIVIENFKNYFTSHAREAGLAAHVGSQYADELWQSLVSRIPLNRFSERNFCYGENHLFWRSPRADILQAVHQNKATSASPEQESKRIFADTGVPLSALPSALRTAGQRKLSVNVLASFVTYPMRWINRILKLEEEDFKAQDSKLFIDFKKEKLSKSAFSRECLALLEKDLDAEAIGKIHALNPKYGIPFVRSAVLSSIEEALQEAFQRKRQLQSSCLKGPFSDSLSYVIPKEISSFFNELTDNVTDFFEDYPYRIVGPGRLEKDPTGVPTRRRYGVITSSKSFVKEALHQLIWIAAGFPYELYLISVNTEDSSEASVFPIKESLLLPFFYAGSREIVLKALLRLFRFQLQHSIGLNDTYTDKKKAQSEEYKRANKPLLWQGIDDEGYDRAKKLSEDISKQLSAYFVSLDVIGGSKNEPSKLATSIDELTDSLIQTLREEFVSPTQVSTDPTEVSAISDTANASDAFEMPDVSENPAASISAIREVSKPPRHPEAQASKDQTFSSDRVKSEQKKEGDDL